MKTLFFSLLVMLSSLHASGQVLVDGENINDLSITYCQIIGINRIGFAGTRVWVDYGQPKFVANHLNAQRISGRDQQPIKFNTVIDALNFLVANGWELVSSSITSDNEGGASRFIYLLRKR